MKNIVNGIALFSLLLVVSATASAQDERLGRDVTRRLMSAFNQAETLSSNVQRLASEPLQGTWSSLSNAEFKKQTAWLQEARAQVETYKAGIAEVLRDSIVTRKELAHVNSLREAINVKDPSTGTLTGALLRRHDEANAIFQAVVTNE
jgi:hypothetical protein